MFGDLTSTTKNSVQVLTLPSVSFAITVMLWDPPEKLSVIFPSGLRLSFVPLSNASSTQSTPISSVTFQLTKIAVVFRYELFVGEPTVIVGGERSRAKLMFSMW